MGSEDSKHVEPTSAREGEVLPREDDSTENEKEQSPEFAQIFAQITQYTNRPDLLLETLEKHSPGFIDDTVKRANRIAEREAEGRFHFGKRQAYTALVVSVIAAAGVIGALFYAFALGAANFLTIVGLGVFYAISQGGGVGFSKIVAGIQQLVGRHRKDSAGD